MLICYHHNDMDGRVAGALVHHMCPRTVAVDTTDSYFMCGYESPMDKHSITDDVFIVDLSFTDDTYQKLIEITKTARSVTWIDHHKSSTDMIKNHFDELQSIRNLTYFVDESFCGAVNVYIYFILLTQHNKYFDLVRKTDFNAGERYSIFVTPRLISAFDNEEKVYQPNVTLKKWNEKTDNSFDITTYTVKINLPTFLLYVDDYDCWKQLMKASNLFKLGFMANNTNLILNDDRNGDYFNPLYDSLINLDQLSESVERMVDDGYTISKYLTNTYTDMRKELAFTWTYNGTKFLCMNGSADSSLFGDQIHNYPAVIMFKCKPGIWLYSVYAADESKFDCEAFCKKFGGGGHFHASGFSSEKFIFTDHDFNKKTYNDVIFLGGTCNDPDWRSEFINQWKKINHPKTQKYELFNPIVDDWTPECAKKDNQIKKNAKINLFVITPQMTGPYSCLEAMYCTDNYDSKTVFVIYNCENGFDTKPGLLKSLTECANLLKSKGAIVYNLEDKDAMEQLVKLMIVEDDLL